MGEMSCHRLRVQTSERCPWQLRRGIAHTYPMSLWASLLRDLGLLRAAGLAEEVDDRLARVLVLRELHEADALALRSASASDLLEHLDGLAHGRGLTRPALHALVVPEIAYSVYCATYLNKFHVQGGSVRPFSECARGRIRGNGFSNAVSMVLRCLRLLPHQRLKSPSAPTKPP